MQAEDEQLLDRLRSCGHQALAEAFTEYRDRFERILSFRLDARVRGRMDPQDVLQEAFLAMASRLEEYLSTPSVSLFVWMRQRVLQTMIDMQRSQFRDKRDPNREIRFLASSPVHTTSMSIARYLLDDVTSPSQHVVRAEEAMQLESALDAMQEIDREVLALRHFEQLTNQQVAEVLEITPTAASNRYVRAASRLGEILTNLGHGTNGNKSS
ncbi:MAG: sigma-70 family RNA polymerase sigma factor [Pirellulales bacterium]